MTSREIRASVLNVIRNNGIKCPGCDNDAHWGGHNITADCNYNDCHCSAVLKKGEYIPGSTKRRIYLHITWFGVVHIVTNGVASWKVDDEKVHKIELMYVGRKLVVVPDENDIKEPDCD